MAAGSLKLGCVPGKELESEVDVLAVLVRCKTAHEQAAAIADARQTATSLNELLEQLSAMRSQITLGIHSLVEGGGAVPAS